MEQLFAELQTASRKLGTSQGQLLKLKLTAKKTANSQKIVASVKERYAEGETLRQELAVLVAHGVQNMCKSEATALKKRVERWEILAKTAISQAKPFVPKP